MTRQQPQLRSLGWACGLVGLSFVGCSSTPLVPPLVPAAAPAATTATTLAAPAPSCSLPQFLGIPQLFQGTFGLLRHTRDCLAAQLGTFFPGLEPTPPLKLLTDPANLSPDAPPSVQTAAEIKAKEDEAPQKAKAIAYLATIGCGCYEGVAEALAESLTDCSEEVRYATVKALRDLGMKNCACCGGNRQPNQLSLHIIQAGGFGIHRKIAPRPSARDPRFQRLRIADAGVGGGINGQRLRLWGVMVACHFKALTGRQNRSVDLQLF